MEGKFTPTDVIALRIETNETIVHFTGLVFYFQDKRKHVFIYLHLTFMPLYKNNIGMKIQGV